MTSQRSFSGRCFHGGMGPRPFEIFQKSSPSVSFCTRSDVQSAGLGVRAAAAGPSPLPDAPWHDIQFVSTVFLALPIPFTGFFIAFASGGATHGPVAAPCAHAPPNVPAATSATVATAAPTMLTNALMSPPSSRDRDARYVRAMHATSAHI